MTAAVRAAAEYAFANFDLCRLFAAVFDGNMASARVLEKAGFTFEARLKKTITKGDRTLDELVYAIVALARLTANHDRATANPPSAATTGRPSLACAG